jgi:RHS repeat-associated protein
MKRIQMSSRSSGRFLSVACSLLASGALAGCRDAATAPPKPPTEPIVEALNATPKTSDFAIEATNSVRLQTGGLVASGGDIGALGTTGPFLADGAAVDALGGVQVQASRTIIAGTVNLGKGAVVGDIEATTVTGGAGAKHGTIAPLVPLPAIPAAAAVSPGTANVTVASGATKSIYPGHFAAVTVGTGGTLKMYAGAYDLASLTMASNARITVLGAVQIHIAGRLSTSSGVCINAASGVKLTASGIRIEVSGQNGTTGALGATPAAAAFGSGNNVTALVLVPNGTLVFGTYAVATGAFMGRDVDVGGTGTKIVYQDGFPNTVTTCSPPSCDDGNPCTVDSCGSNGACAHAPAPQGTSCGDGNACNGTETCDGAGTCKPGTPVSCTAKDSCHLAGTCDPTTGACSNPAATDGTKCDDGNACTQTDACLAGTCTGGDSVTCKPLDQCHAAGTCDQKTGVCSTPALADGTTCDDGNACTQADTCQAGTCTAGTPIACAGGDQCHGPGVCDPITGACANPALTDGTPCNDGNACTQMDACLAGVCAGSNPVTCTPSDQCHVAGSCDPSTGACSNPIAANGTPCNDGTACTRTDTCQAGACQGGDPVTCVATDQCHTAGTCDPASGACSNPAKADGETCDDGNRCTQADNCQAGTCKGAALNVDDGNPCTTDSCDPATGAAHAPVAAGTGCADGLPCSGAQVCDGHGACIPVDDGNSCTVDVCDPGQGLSHVPVAAGTPCSTSASCPGQATCDGAGTCSACTVGKLELLYGENQIPSGGSVTVPSVLAGSKGVVIPLTLTNVGSGDVTLSGTPNVTISGPNAADFSIQQFPTSTLAAGKSETIQVKFAPSAPGNSTATLQINSNDAASPLVISLTATGLAPGDLNAATNGDFAAHTAAACNTREARLMVRTGDIDNLGFKFPQGFDPFSGQNTPSHSYPWPVDPNDPAGTDRIEIGSSFSTGCNDGYCGTTTRPGNLPQCIALNLELDCAQGTTPSSGLIQMFVDDFQPRVWGSLFQVTINGQRAPQIEAGINLLAQTGPIGKLMTFTLTPDQLALLKPGAVTICVDDPTTGKGDGYAIDFVKLLVDVYGTDKKGSINGRVTDARTGAAIAGATVSAGGVVTATSDATGNYALASVPAGFVYLFANATGYQTQGQVVDLTDGQTNTVNIAMSANAPPVITSTPVTQVLVGATYSYKVVATDADNDSLTWGIPQNKPPGLSMNEFTGQITWSPTADQVGDWPITVEVNDRRGGVTTQSFTITVGAANRPPTVACQQDLHLVGSSATVSISCPVTDDGKLNATPTLTWSSNFKGTAPPTLTPTGDSAEAVLSAPGIYQFTLTADDGEFQVPGSVIVTLSPSANPALAVYAGTDQAITDLTTNLSGTAIGGSGALLASWTQLDGPAAAQIATPADESTAVTFTAIGTYDFRLTVTDGQSIDSDDVKVIVVPSSGTGATGTQGWIGAPLSQTTVNGLVEITVAAGVTVTSGTLSYFPATNPGDTHVLTATASGGPGVTLATLDTTVLRNGSYIIDLTATDSHGNQLESDILVTVDGDYKPGREVVEVTDFTVPIAGLPIKIGRRYDSLERELVGDFGSGWSLTIGHPDLQVDQANDVTITLPNGRRATFLFEMVPPVVGPVILGFLGLPTYVPEAGVFGKLTSDGCPLLSFDPSNPDPICFAAIDQPDPHYRPTTFTYTDSTGVAYTMGADGSLKSIQDRNNNVLTFTPGGIVSEPSGETVAFTRDAQGRITKILTPAQFEYDYTYDANGNLVSAKQPPQNTFAQLFKYAYDTDHRLLTTTDPAAHQTSSTYDAAGRLASSTDGMGNVTRYAYDVLGHNTVTTYPDTGVVAQTFDDNGMLLSQTDQLGRTTTHAYDANRNEIKLTNALGEISTYTYDANGNRTSNTNSRGEKVTATYNDFSETLTRTDQIGNTTAVAYDATGIPTSISDSEGPLATFKSSAQGLPTAATDAVGVTAFMTYDDAGNLTGHTDRLGRQTAVTYDAMGRKTAMVDPRGGVTSYSYDEDGDPTFTQNPLGFGPLVHYDADRNIQQIQDVNAGELVRGDEFTYDADNHLVTITHDSDRTQIHQTSDFRGNVLTSTDEVGNTTSYAYDLAGQLVKTTYPDGTFTTQSYDALGRLQSRTDERGNTTTYAYQPGCDCAARLTSVTDPLGRTTSMTYDAMGRKTSMTDAIGHRTSYAYDLRGHLIETDYADGTAIHDTYDTLGRRTASADQTGAKTLYGYDAEGQLTSVTDALGNLTKYGYDANGNLTSMADANHHVTTFVYDAANRKVSRTLPLGMTETFGYDGDGNTVSHTDFRGKTSSYVYDGRRQGGRLVSKAPDPSLAEPTVKYAYNANNTRSSMTDASGTTAYTYDKRNRMLTKATPEGTLTYTYDAGGNVTGTRSANTNGTSVAYAWDAANQLASVTDNRLSATTTTVHTATGRPASVSQPNGVGLTYVYDSLDRVTSIAWNQGAAPTFASWNYTYSARGQRLSSTDVTGRKASYEYDAGARLTGETIEGDPTRNGTLAYALDAVGNRSSRTSTLAALESQSFSYDSNDELTSDEFDSNGNTTSSGGHAFAYDFENRLVSKDGGAITLLYDGDGNRVAKTVNGVTTKYLVDDLNPTGYLQVMEEVSGVAVQVRYTYGDMLVSQTRTVSTTPAVSFYGYDAHGNITFLTDANGTVTDTYDYDGWGNLVASTGATANTRLYAAEELDPDLGLINLRARQYRPATGRFLTIDPTSGIVSNPLTLNRYLYTNGDPINMLDPAGRASASEYAVFITNFAFTYINTFVLPGMDNGHKKCAWLFGTGFAGIIKLATNSIGGLIAGVIFNLLCRGV